MQESPNDLARRLIDVARRDGRRSLDEAAAKQVLAAYGIDVPRSVRIPLEGPMPGALADLAAPYVLKIMSRDVLHKSDMGGVRLALADALAVSAARADMTNAAARADVRLDGFLVEEMAPAGHDIVIGAFRDASFGQTLMFGLGGIFVELLKDVSFRICPIQRVDACEMIAEVRSAPVLLGARGGVAVAEARLVDLLMLIGGPRGLLEDLADELAEVDLNPIIVSATGAVAADARFLLTERAGHGD